MKKISALTTLCLVILQAVPALAVQHHGGTEGLVAHQTGHLLFIAGMAYLLISTWRERSSASGWPQFTTFLIFILLWNLLTFSGHWLAEYILPSQFQNHAGHHIAFTIHSSADMLFYLSRLDHLLLLPALYFLFLALKKWRRQS
ncbi:hypothetical protein ACOHYD_08320 [Desulfobacterota bacterium M19]